MMMKKSMKIHTIIIICLQSRTVAKMYIIICNFKVSPSIHVLLTSDLNSTNIFASLLSPVYGKIQNHDIMIDVELPSAMSVTNANINNAAHTNISAFIHRNMNFSDREKDFISEGSINGCISEGYISDIWSISSEESARAKK